MKSSKLAALALGGLIMASCASNKTGGNPGEKIFEPIDYTLSVTEIDAPDSTYIYLYDYDALAGKSDATAGDAVIDSVMITNRQALFNIKGSTAPVAILQIKGNIQYLILPEAGENTYNYTEKKGSGTLANAYKIYRDSLNAIYEHASANLPERGTPAYTAFCDSVDNLIDTFNRSSIEANVDNALGFYIAASTAARNLEQADSIIALTPYWASTKRMALAAETAAKLKATSPGQQYTDFTIESNGKSVKLSDYVKPGQYTLVDFWASWCGPCKRAIAELKKNYDQLHGKGLNIVGVTVWENPEKTQEWLKDNPLPWDIILDAQSVPTDIYAVDGIPTLVLIGPDGKIIARSHSDKEVLDAFNAAISK